MQDGFKFILASLAQLDRVSDEVFNRIKARVRFRLGPLHAACLVLVYAKVPVEWVLQDAFACVRCDRWRLRETAFAASMTELGRPRSELSASPATLARPFKCLQALRTLLPQVRGD
jgi:hypothetical protein